LSRKIGETFMIEKRHSALFETSTLIGEMPN